MVNDSSPVDLTESGGVEKFWNNKVCSHLICDCRKIDYLPYASVSSDVQPIYKEVKGWKTDLTKLSSINEVPKELNDYVEYLEQELNVPITIVSVGPDRKQTLIREKLLV